jgi:hypothetical protein
MNIKEQNFLLLNRLQPDPLPQEKRITEYRNGLYIDRTTLALIKNYEPESIVT